jgi:hypothetical protein
MRTQLTPYLIILRRFPQNRALQAFLFQPHFMYLNRDYFRFFFLFTSYSVNCKVTNQNDNKVNQSEYKHYQPRAIKSLKILIIFAPFVTFEKNYVKNHKKKNMPVLNPSENPTNKPPKRYYYNHTYRENRPDAQK